MFYFLIPPATHSSFLNFIWLVSQSSSGDHNHRFILHRPLSSHKMVTTLGL
ncbi:mCG147241 [Mus musculus]|uniref:Uncharacterized protein n=1 Tax=Mus musculus TaxID=10090 RepID=Q3UP46_MOUSE|nr:mCG147241 [Mus musculus]BAE25551.1 unnamed protein product [Mus musculus]